MCKAPKPPKAQEPEKPEFLRNPYLDAAVGQRGTVTQLRQGRSSLRIPLASGLGIEPTGSNPTPTVNPPNIAGPATTPSRLPGLPGLPGGDLTPDLSRLSELSLLT